MKPYYSENGIDLYYADCREVLPSLSPLSCLITDPPYSHHTHNKQWIGAALTSQAKPRVSTRFKELGFDPLTPELMGFICQQTTRLVQRWSLFFSDLETISTWQMMLQGAGLEYVRSCVWDKVDSAPQFTGDRPAASAEAIVCAHPKGKKNWNGGGRRNVFRFPVNGSNGGSKPHPSTKPLELMSELVRLFSSQGELILDPFMGSGTTLVAAKELGRQAIGVETEERYCEIAANRLRDTAVLFMPLEAETIPDQDSLFAQIA